MKQYEKPQVTILSETTEGVYAASGDNAGKGVTCRFGREEANGGSDVCQSCSKTNGMFNNAQAYKSDYKGCVDHMPEK